MENLKKARSSLRGLLTKSVNKFEEYLQEDIVSKKDLNVLLGNVEQRALKIAKLDQEINALMTASEDINVEEFDAEFEVCFAYESKVSECRCAVDEILSKDARNASDQESVSFKSTGGCSRD